LWIDIILENPGDMGAAIIGGVIITAVPIAIGVYGLCRGKKAAEWIKTSRRSLLLKESLRNSILDDSVVHAGQVAYVRGLRQGKGWQNTSLSLQQVHKVLEHD